MMAKVRRRATSRSSSVDMTVFVRVASYHEGLRNHLFRAPGRVGGGPPPGEAEPPPPVAAPRQERIKGRPPSGKRPEGNPPPAPQPPGRRPSPQLGLSKPGMAVRGFTVGSGAP